MRLQQKQLTSEGMLTRRQHQNKGVIRLAWRVCNAAAKEGTGPQLHMVCRHAAAGTNKPPLVHLSTIARRPIAVLRDSALHSATSP